LLYGKEKTLDKDKEVTADVHVSRESSFSSTPSRRRSFSSTASTSSPHKYLTDYLGYQCWSINNTEITDPPYYNSALLQPTSSAVSAVMPNDQQILLDALPVIHLSHCYSNSNRIAVAADGKEASRSSAASDLLSSSSFRSSLLISLLDQLIEAGDVQSCCCLLTVVGVSASSTSSLPRDRIQHWYWSYLELLQRLGLFSSVVEMMQNCGDDKLQEMNTKSTTISLICLSCRKPSTELGSYCHNCHSALSRCSICDLPVNGLFVWCQGCGHGGHQQHLQQWFQTEETCPAGCQHHCIQQTLNKNNNINNSLESREEAAFNIMYY